MIEFDKLPCWACKAPQAADIRCYLGQCGGEVAEANRSPFSGLPIGCCRIRSTSISADGIGQFTTS
jgi:hypothetical protein